MGDTGSLRATTAREAVVRPLARVADRNCVRPGCPAPAQASLSFRYASREAWLERLTEEPTPEAYDLCSSHAAKTQPPHGWELRDRRPRDEQLPQEPVPVERDLGGQDTVAVLAAALRAVPETSGGPEHQDDVPDAPSGTEAPAAAVAAVEVEPDVDDASAATDAEAPFEESTSPVLEQPRVPRLFPEPEDDAPVGENPGPDESGGRGSAADESPDAEAGAEREARPTPRPVPAARSRGIAPPANRSVTAPHGTALDW